MTTKRTRFTDSRSWPFDLGLCVLGLALLVWSLPIAWDGGWKVGLAALIGVPLVVVIARFPMVLDNEDGSIEIGFDSIVLIYLLCTFDALPALAVWGLGVVATQLTSGKRASAFVFNIGVGILAGAVAAGVLHLVRGSATGTPRELVAVVAAAAAYFFLDYVLTAVSVAIDSQTPVRRHLVQPGTWLAVACFVPFDLLGYLAAVVLRSNPWWTLVLLVVPLATLLVNTRAIVHGRENARRLSVLFEAAVRVQALHEPGLVIDGSAGRRATADPAARRGRAQLAARGARDRCAGTPGQGRALGRRHVAGPRPVDGRRRPARARRARRDLLGGVRPPPADRRDGPLRAARPPDRPAQPRHPARPGRAGPAPRPPARRTGGAALRRPRRLQAGQRPVRPRCG